MTILGLSFLYHDAAAALIRDGELVAFGQEERFSRVKHDGRFPKNAIKFVLKEANIDARDLDLVAYYEKPSIRILRLTLWHASVFPRCARLFSNDMFHTVSHLLPLRDTIAESLGIAKKRVIFVPHHLSHAATAYFTSGFPHAAVLTVDGVGDGPTAALSRGKGTRLSMIESIDYPHSLGLFYSAFTEYLGFEINDGEYKIMGMAGYGSPRYVSAVEKLLSVDESGLRLDLSYFNFHRASHALYSARFVDLFGEPRARESPFSHANGVLFETNQRFADIASSVQFVIENAMCSLSAYALKRTGEKNLCLSGGVALNSRANWKIRLKFPAISLAIPPDPTDAGSALGAALAVHHSVNASACQFTFSGQLTGSRYSDEDVESFLREKNISFSFIPSFSELSATIAKRIADGAIVGWFQGRSEFGPRALGNRSILADPRNNMNRDAVNKRIKFREPFRPFAPAVLSEQASRYFAIGSCADSALSTMLFVVDALPCAHTDIPAVIHVDGTARIQTVTEESNPRFHSLISAFNDITAIPVILNTSFNIRGEPIVETPADAFRTFLASNLDVLVLGSHVVERTRL